MNKFLIPLILLFFAMNATAGSIENLHAKEWAVPKKASTLILMPAIRKSMQKLEKEPRSSLTIRYPGGDEGTLWANELRSWLIALGLVSSRIDLVPGSPKSNIIELEVITN